MRAVLICLLALFMGAVFHEVEDEPPPGIEVPAQKPDDWDAYPCYCYVPDWVETGVEEEVDKLDVPTDDPNVRVVVTVLWFGVFDHEHGCTSEFNGCECPECLDYCCTTPGSVMYRLEFRSETPLGVSFYKTFGMIDQRVDRSDYGAGDGWPTTNTWKCRGKVGITECPYEAIRAAVEEYLGHSVNEIHITWVGAEE